MALRFLNKEVSELCLGKPELKWIPATATVSDALAALKSTDDAYISVWLCGANCVCVGKFCMADAILFLCRKENLGEPFKALQAPVSDILPKGLNIVRHLESYSSLSEAIDCILEGTQNLVIPIQNHWFSDSRKRLIHTGHDCCWLTQEDVVRFLLNSVGSFSPIPTLSIESLDLIYYNIMTVTYNKPASSALDYFHRALTEQKSVAVVDEENRLMGEISPSSLSRCDETAASAILSLSAMDLMTYIDCGGVGDAMDEAFQALSSSSSSCCSSDDEYGSGRSRWAGESGRYSVGRRCEAIVCSRRSSLVAVMIQALAHRVGCVWVVEEDRRLVGIVTLAGILNVFRSAVC